ncbi:uncharacterized protein LOC107630989 [Arachis ipaensis]|uniref:uncharacterized protein LOC107630989 n=1 Tax=Arachis ipaensis TaxID=130454 RepID=UPI000A2B7AD6|nr:uncharacterized protein LOC107630989 [Arachis ipaensis]
MHFNELLIPRIASTQANASENLTNIPASQSGSTVGIASKRKVSKNALGSRTDVGWEHGISVGEDGKKIQSVSDEVKKQMWDVVSGLQVNLMKKISMGGASPGEATKEVDTTGEKRKEKELDGNIFKKTRISTQTTINNIFKNNLREEVCLEISAFFYNNGIPFNVSRSEEYSRMFEKAIRYGQGFKPPSYHELRVPLLKKHVELVQQSLEEHRAYWKQVGCMMSG